MSTCSMSKPCSVKTVMASFALQGGPDLGGLLVDYFESKLASTQTAGVCSHASQGPESASQAVQRLTGIKSPGPKVLIVCADPAGTLSDEVIHVNEYNKALQAEFSSHMMAYVSDTRSQVCTWLLLCPALRPSWVQAIGCLTSHKVTSLSAVTTIKSILHDNQWSAFVCSMHTV